jgi:hypothetical protein
VSRPVPNPVLLDAVLSILADHRRQFAVEETGEVFPGIVETDLASALRERRWRLPRGWLSEVEEAGFRVRPVYRIGTVRTHFDEPPKIDRETGRPFRYDAFQRRSLPRYTTIISL